MHLCVFEPMLDTARSMSFISLARLFNPMSMVVGKGSFEGGARDRWVTVHDQEASGDNDLGWRREGGFMQGEEDGVIPSALPQWILGTRPSVWKEAQEGRGEVHVESCLLVHRLVARTMTGLD